MLETGGELAGRQRPASPEGVTRAWIARERLAPGALAPKRSIATTRSTQRSQPIETPALDRDPA